MASLLLDAVASNLPSLGSAPVNLIDINAFKPPEEYKVTKAQVDRVWQENEMYDEDTMDFFARVFARSGLNEKGTYLPPTINPVYCGNKPRTDLAAAAEECEEAVCSAVAGLLAKTGIRPKDIDILVSTCSIYCPTPSMASMLVNKFGLRSDVHTYHLGGMGCSNGVVAVSLVRDLLKAHPNSNCVFVTVEVTTPAYYPGKDRHRLVTNLIFRMGASASLWSNSPSWAGRAKYRLEHAERVHVGGKSQDAYTAIHYGPDEEGINGIYLGKNVVTEASRALTMTLTKVAPKVLSAREKARYVVTEARRRLQGPEAVPEFRPDFASCVDHFVIHAGGAKVLDGIGKALALGPEHLQPSRSVLYDYGNVSSSTTWYSLAWIETVRGVKAGDTVMQIGVGSGIKCGVNILRALRNVKETHRAWEHLVAAPPLPAAQLPAGLAAAPAGPDSPVPVPPVVRRKTTNTKVVVVPAAAPHVDTTHAWRAHVAARLVFLGLMLAVALCMHAYLFATSPSSGSGSGLAAAPAGAGAGGSGSVAAAPAAAPAAAAAGATAGSCEL